MYGNFVWWQGVVEDRIDPLKLGRCRVRILGYHTDNKVEGEGIPTEHLPWATPSQPITSAAMNGIGTTPMGPVEGTWVFGFFRDGENAQEPVMMGTFGGIPEDPSNPVVGFNDPDGVYPLTTHLDEQDTNRLARGSGEFPVPLSSDTGKTSEDSPSLSYKRETRNTDVPTALAGDITTTIPNTNNSVLYAVSLWNEPNPRYGGTGDNPTQYLPSVELSSMYPYNHVRMSESGHVEEWDDTPTAERLHKFHKSGTFEEIQPDGTKITKIVGNEYEITLGHKGVLIHGTCNVTIAGDCRMLYQGDLVQEVYGDYHLNVHGDTRTKILGNEAKEILADQKIVVNGTSDFKIGQDQILNITGDSTINIMGDAAQVVSGNLAEMIFGDTTNIVGGNLMMVTTGNLDLSSGGNFGISTAANLNKTITGLYQTDVSGAYALNILSGIANTEAFGGIYNINAGVINQTAGAINLN